MGTTGSTVSGLETFLEEVKFELANGPSKRPKDNLSPGERRALHNLLGDKTTTVKPGFHIVVSLVSVVSVVRKKFIGQI